MKAQILIPYETELEIIEYYKLHSVLNTAQHFNLSRHHINRVLAKYNIEKHSKEFTTKLGRELYKENAIKKYGVPNTGALPEVIEKRRQTMIAKYGVENAYKSPEIKDKIKNTLLDKYGVECVAQIPSCAEKKKQTCLGRYGHDNPMKDKNINEKSRQTKINKYGTLRLSHKVCYRVDDEVFDSFPELCFYLYHIKNNINILHEKIILEYYYKNCKHYYTPDFKVNETLIEIKGPQLVADSGE